MKRGGQNHQRKRPHMLPPLSSLQGHTPGPMDPLQPPSIISLEGRLGSPTPRWHRPSAEELELFQEHPSEGRPTIRLTPCLDQEGNTRDKRVLKLDQEGNAREKRLSRDTALKLDQEGNARERRVPRDTVLKLDLRNDPLFKEDNDLLYAVQRRNSIRTLGLDQKNFGRKGSNLKNINLTKHIEPEDEKMRPRGEAAESRHRKGTTALEKAVHLPSRYLPLKPIPKKPEAGGFDHTS